jgi:hypothetical protein
VINGRRRFMNWFLGTSAGALFGHRMVRRYAAEVYCAS